MTTESKDITAGDPEAQTLETKPIHALTKGDMQKIADITGGYALILHAAVTANGIEGCDVSWRVNGPSVYLTLITGVLRKDGSGQLDTGNTPLLLLKVGGENVGGFSRLGTVNLDESTVTISDPKSSGWGGMDPSLSLTIKRGEHGKPSQIIVTRDLEFKPTDQKVPSLLS